jgi:sigma-B regulation protein RsbU (phosphoserine phosphatase)
MHSKGKIATRLILIISLSTTLIVAVMLAVTQWRARQIIEQEVLANATNMTKAVASQIATVLEDTTWVVEKMANRLERASMSDAELQQMLQDALENNPQIYGSTASFEPGVLIDGTRRHAPYVYRKGDAIDFRKLEDSYNYLQQDWYRIPSAQGRALWSEPYFDEGGGDSLMTTYSVPFYRGQAEHRQLAGIVTGDIALDWLANVIGAFKALEGGYSFLLSREGRVMFHPDGRYLMQETVFSLAEKMGDDSFRTIGQRMMRGESDFISYTNPKGVKARLYFGPIPMTGWSMGIVFPEAALFADIARLSLMIASLGSLGVLLIALVVMVVSRTITQPLQDLALAAGRISGGDFSTQLPAAEASDEVGDLSRALTLMQADLQEHIQALLATTSTKERLESELGIAHEIQMSLLPRLPVPFPGKGRLDLYAIMEPAKEVGGDFFDFFWLDEQRLCLVIADVSGKGVPAALFMAVSKTLLKALASQEAGPAAMLTRLNNQLATDNEQSMFVTLFCAVIDTGSGLMTYANAGHNPPLLLPQEGRPAFLSSKRQLVIGAMEDYAYQEESHLLRPGDLLLLYTDGVTEAMDPTEALFGEARLLETACLLQAQCVIDLLGCTLASIKAFGSTAPQSDDITLMGVRFYGEGLSTDSE